MWGLFSLPPFQKIHFFYRKIYYISAHHSLYIYTYIILTMHLIMSWCLYLYSPHITFYYFGVQQHKNGKSNTESHALQKSPTLLRQGAADLDSGSVLL